MLYRILRILIFVIFLLASCKDSIFAEDEEWCPNSLGPVTTWTAPLCGKRRLAVQPFFFYNRTRGSFDTEGHYNSLPKGDKKYQYQEQLFAQYGITDKFEIDGQILYQQDYIRQGGKSAHSDGWRDSYLFLRYCAVEETDKLPHLTGVFQLKIPTGKYQKADANKLGTDLKGATSGGGSYDPGIGIILTKRMRPFILHIDGIYSFPQEVKVDNIKTEYGKYLVCDFGVEYFLSGGFNLMLEFNGFLQDDKLEGGAKTPASDINYLTVVSGIGWSNERIQTLLSYQRALTGTNTDAEDSAICTFVYTF